MDGSGVNYSFVEFNHVVPIRERANNEHFSASVVPTYPDY